MKRFFNLSSPAGIALTVAGVILALSPEARKAARQVLVKGTSLVLGTVDSLKNTAGEITSGITTGVSHSLAKVDDMVHESSETAVESASEMGEWMMDATTDSGTVGHNRTEFH